MSASPEFRRTTFGGAISSISQADQYNGLTPPKVGEFFVITDPSSPVRTHKDLAEIGKLEDGAPLGTSIDFGHPVRVREIGTSGYVSVKLPTHGNDPVDDKFHLALESHKLRIPISPEQAEIYANRPAAVVIAKEGVHVQDVATGSRHRLDFGARIHDLSGDTFSVGLDGIRRSYKLLDGLLGLGSASREGVTVADFGARVMAFDGAHFGWGERTRATSDASGWIQNVLNSYAVNSPHNSSRMLDYLRTSKIGTEVTKMSDLEPGDILFIGVKGRGINYVAMFERDEAGRPCMRHCRGRLGWQASYLTTTSEILGETELVGFPTSEIKAAWRALQLHK